MKIKVNGPIISNDQMWIYDWLDYEATCPKNIISQLEKANGDDVEVEINSGGGEIFSASEIYTSLKSYGGKVVTRVVGIAASAASVIAMAGDKVEMSPTAQMMIHNVSISGVSGDHRDMEHYADVLKTSNQTIANAYKIKTGKSEEELLEYMNSEKWMSAQEAKSLGFIDDILFEQPTLINGAGFILPDKFVNSLKNEREEMMNLRIENERLKVEMLKGGKL